MMTMTRRIVAPALLVISIVWVGAGQAQGKRAATETKPEAVSEKFDIQRDLTPLDRDNAARIVSFADIVEPVTPGVVSIFTELSAGDTDEQNELDEFLRRMYGLPPRGGEEDSLEQGMGSGFIVSPDGYILTNHHVVSGDDDVVSDKISVVLTDGREYDAQFVGSDPKTDIAVLKISAENLPVLTMGDSDGLRVGDIVFALGNPLEVGLTVTQGIVSAKGRTDLLIPDGPEFQNFIQTDAAINLGNSGGPLIDGEGRVVGINAAILSTGYYGGSIGIGFAIPINLAYRVMNSLIDSGEVRRGFVGMQLGPLSRNMALAFELESTKGALVESVMPGLPADEAGIEHGDVILSADGELVDTPRELIFLISRRSPGETIDMELLRWGERQTVQVTLGDRDALLGIDTGAADMNSTEDAVPEFELLPGVRVSPLDAHLKQRLGLSGDAGLAGLVVREVGEDSPYRSFFELGVVVVEINGDFIDSEDNLRAALKPSGANAFYLYYPEQGYRYVPIFVEE